MANFNAPGSGKKLLQKTPLLNGSGKENLKRLSSKELDKVKTNVPFSRDLPDNTVNKPFK